MTLAITRRPRRPDWPQWVYDIFNQRGLAHLEATYRQLKDESGLERASRISADDIASAILAEHRVQRRSDLLQAGGDHVPTNA